MTYDVNSRLTHVGDRMKQIQVNSAVYHRQGFHEITIDSVTPERALVEDIQAFGIVATIDRMLDLVFDASYLDYSPNPLPQIGDYVTYRGIKYKVQQRNDRCYSYTTTRRDRIRVHLVQV